MKRREFKTKKEYFDYVDEMISYTLPSIERRATAEKGWKIYCAGVGRDPMDTGLPRNPEADAEPATTTATFLRNALAYAEAVKRASNSRFTVAELTEAQLGLWNRGPDGRLL